MMPFLLRLLRKFPLWMHLLALRMVRRKFRVAVAAMIFDEQGRILLFKHTYRKFEWGIPAGSLEYNEQPAQAIVREILEETGMDIQVQKLLWADSAKDDRHISLIYLCKIMDGVFQKSLEISEVKYFDVDDLPPMLFMEKELIRRAAKSQMNDD